ncbi:MAG: NADH-quinone oxidoreductase subunit L, partial [Acetobacter orientalis]
MLIDMNLFALAVFLPLAGAVVAGLGGRLMGDGLAKLVTLGCMSVATLCGILTLWHGWTGGFVAQTMPVAEWVN